MSGGLLICICFTVAYTVFLYQQSPLSESNAKSSHPSPEQPTFNDPHPIVPPPKMRSPQLHDISKRQPSEPATVDKGSRNILTRNAKTITRELWRLVNSQLSDQTASDKKLHPHEFLSILSDMTMLMEIKVSGSNRVDGQATKLVQQLDAVSKYVQNQIRELQNPRDCESVKYLVTSVSKACGFGCRAHHWSYCMGIAYALNRTLFLPNVAEDADFWPATSCPSPGRSSKSFVHAKPEDRIVYCPIIDGVTSSLLPPAMTADLVDRLEGLHGAPSIWFLGQIFSYLFRVKPSTFKQKLEENIRRLRNRPSTPNYRQPVAGVQIRRTDKINSEASFYPLSQYMVHVERFFKKKEIENRIASQNEGWHDDAFASPSAGSSLNEKPRVFIASDDPSVIEEAKQKYPQYTIIGEMDRAQSAAVGNRKTRDSIKGIITDVILLANTDFLSCTFSSQVCRLAYELMQTHHRYLGDATSNYESLDSLYYFGGQQRFPWRPMMDYPSRGISLRDKFYVFPNYWNGFVDLENAETQKKLKNVPAFLFHPVQLRLPAK